MNPDTRRCRFIAHTADLSALGVCSGIRMIVFKLIIAPLRHREGCVWRYQRINYDHCNPCCPEDRYLPTGLRSSATRLMQAWTGEYLRVSYLHVPPKRLHALCAGPLSMRFL